MNVYPKCEEFPPWRTTLIRNTYSCGGCRWYGSMNSALFIQVTYLGHSLCTPGRPGQLLRSRPLNGSLQISLQSSWASSRGPQLGSSCSLDAPFYSKPPTDRSLSVEKSRDYNKWISHTAMVITLSTTVRSFQSGSKWIQSYSSDYCQNILFRLWALLIHMSRVKGFNLKWAEISFWTGYSCWETVNGI